MIKHDREFWIRHVEGWRASGLTQRTYCRLHRPAKGILLQLDETTVRVMNEPGQANTAVSYVWVARGGAPLAPVILYHYAPGRGAGWPKRFWGTTKLPSDRRV